MVFFCVFSLCLLLETYWGHQLWSLISQKLFWILSSSLRCLVAQIKLYKIRSTCKNQGRPPYALNICLSLDFTLPIFKAYKN